MLPWNAEDLTFDATSFKGTARLFPLPNLVMYPHVVQPLHIFEPRYRDLLNDALDNDGLIAMCVPDPDQPVDLHGRPALSPFACLGKVVTHQRLDNGCYNLMLLGMQRIRIAEELPQTRRYREARVELLNDCYLAISGSLRDKTQARLTEAFSGALPEDAMPNEAINEILSDDIPLSVLTHLVSFALPLPDEIKRALLSECNVDIRTRLLLKTLRSVGDSATTSAQASPSPLSLGGNGPLGGTGFPPPFSAN